MFNRVMGTIAIITLAVLLVSCKEKKDKLPSGLSGRIEGRFIYITKGFKSNYLKEDGGYVQNSIGSSSSINIKGLGENEKDTVDDFLENATACNIKYRFPNPNISFENNGFIYTPTSKEAFIHLNHPEIVLRDFKISKMK